MSDFGEREWQRNVKTLMSLKAVAQHLRALPIKIAEFYANGGPGVGDPVVGDRFKGIGNSRFEPLSKPYAEWKMGKSKEFNTAQKARFGRGSKLLDVKVGTATRRDKVTGFYVTKDIVKKSLPILVLTGALRAAVTSRNNRITSLIGMGDVAYITFMGLPEYALAHHDPKKPGRKRRSPVAANLDDMKRLVEFTKRHISLIVGKFNHGTVTYGGAKARIVV